MGKIRDAGFHDFLLDHNDKSVLTYVKLQVSSTYYTKPPEVFGRHTKRTSLIPSTSVFITSAVGTTPPNHQHRMEAPFVPGLDIYIQMPTIRHPDPALFTGFENVFLPAHCTSSADMELPECFYAITHVPHAKGKCVSSCLPPRMFSFTCFYFLRVGCSNLTSYHAQKCCARERRRPLIPKNATAGTSCLPNSTVTQQSSGATQAQSSSQLHAAVSAPPLPSLIQ
jgi:hypothetical protein